MSTLRIAPEDGIWVCAACGKTAVDRYGVEGPHSSGWDESCFLNAVLCKRDGITPGDRVNHAETYITSADNTGYTEDAARATAEAERDLMEP